MKYPFKARSRRDTLDRSKATGPFFCDSFSCAVGAHSGDEGSLGYPTVSRTFGYEKRKGFVSLGRFIWGCPGKRKTPPACHLTEEITYRSGKYESDRFDFWCLAGSGVCLKDGQIEDLWGSPRWKQFLPSLGGPRKLFDALLQNRKYVSLFIEPLM